MERKAIIMRLSEKIEKALNAQIKEEFDSAYLYLSMAAYLKSKKFPGFAKWMEAQMQEEFTHAIKLYSYVNERGGRVVLEGLKKPQENWNSPQEVFEAAYAHECYISDKIDELVRIARNENDNATEGFLQWFVNEQVEEEASTSEIVDKFKFVGESKNGLFMLDNALGQRGEK